MPLDRASKALLVVLNLLAVLLGGTFYPFFGKWGMTAALAAALAIDLLVALGWRTGLVRLRRSPLLLKLLTAGFAAAALVGGAELGARALHTLGWIDIYRPMRTLNRAGSQTVDWRFHHITSDFLREPDPELLWQPIASSPYTIQRFQGPVVEVPKPAGVFRIICYGDSNTDGPGDGGYAGWLNELYARDHRVGMPMVEVLNAGVCGYSSHQGLLRFRREVDRFQPDLVLVSFGWNDTAPATIAPDRTFRAPSPAVRRIEEVLVRYRAWLALLALFDKLRPASADYGAVVGPRVSRDDYVDNLEGFRSTAATKGSRIVFLTRPHLRDQQVLPEVPAYNDALRSFASRSNSVVVDVQRMFEQRDYDFVDACHFSRGGHRAMAEMLIRQLADSRLVPYLPSIPRYQWGTRLAMRQDAEGLRYLLAGWGQIEPTIIWNEGPHAGWAIPVSSPGTPTVRLDARVAAFVVPGKLESQRIGVMVGGQPVGEWTMREGGPLDLSLEFPAELLASGEARIELSFPDATSPKTIGLSDDPRCMAAGFESIGLTPLHR